MMPVIRLNDATFVDLKSIATWLGTDTPSQTIDKLVKERMALLDLERDEEESLSDTSTKSGRVSEKAPSLTFTRILSATVNKKKLTKANWAGMLIQVISIVKSKGYKADLLVKELQIPAMAKPYEIEGYRYYPEIGISIQGQSASDAWKEISRLAEKHAIPVDIEFQWRQNKNAMHPGKVSTIRAGQ